METTDVIAWWGAIVATSVLAWDILKWFKSGPRLRTRIVLNVHYDDGKVIATEKTEAGEITTYEEYCHLELVNVGTMPTTVMSISATHKARNGGFRMGVSQQVFTEHFGKKLPHVLSPGEVWSCRLPMGRYTKLLEYGTPELHASVSHLAKPLVIRASRSANEALNLRGTAGSHLHKPLTKRGN